MLPTTHAVALSSDELEDLIGRPGRELLAVGDGGLALERSLVHKSAPVPPRPP